MYAIKSAFEYVIGLYWNALPQDKGVETQEPNAQQKQEDIQESSTKTPLSSLDPQIQHQSELRRLHEQNKEVKERKALSDLFYGNMTLHKAVESANFLQRLRSNQATKEEYVCYLGRLFEDLSILENLFKTLSFPGKEKLNFMSFFRSDALKQDLDTFASLVEVQDIRKTPLKTHIEHFNQLGAKTPYLLVVHLAMRYYAILHGGQLRAVRLKELWGPDIPTSLYEFESSVAVKGLLQQLSEQLNVFGQTLNDKMYEEFSKEVKLAWVFTGDILGENIRPLLQNS